LKKTTTSPESAPPLCDSIVSSTARGDWLIETGSSVFGHMMREQSGPKNPASQLQTVMDDLSQFVYVGPTPSPPGPGCT
jgi:hypothetical protein